MKTLLISALLCCSFCTAMNAQEYTTPNVLSYYAMGNSIDGQPMVEMANILRFYPVFALRDFTDTVVVTVFYGPYVYTDTARPMDNKHYWEARLPRFELGEAIQRIDVRTTINIKKHPIQKKLEEAYGQIKSELTKHLNNIKAKIDSNDLNSLKELNNKIRGQLSKLDSSNFQKKIKDTATAIINDINSIREILGSLTTSINNQDTTNSGQTELNNIKTTILTELKRYDSSIFKLKIEPPLNDDAIKKINDISTNVNNITQILTSQRSSIIAAGDTMLNSLVIARETLRTNIAGESYEQITDTNYSGPSVRKGDVLIDSDNNRIHILYRNHKTSLRQLPALDPVESMGLFRIRYIPFVITGNSLLTTFTGENNAVFEVGLAFGDVRVSGDDFVKPELSIRRLGVAFAITNRLFGDNARIRALALTYDFNSYGSIAAGVNFPGKNVASDAVNESYISFGINKRAFEQLLKGLTGLF